jgi:hypothetical protein
MDEDGRFWSQSAGAGIKKSGQTRAYQEWGRKNTSFCILGAQSMKNVDTAQSKGFDAGKRVSDIKHHLAVDTRLAACN